MAAGGYKEFVAGETLDQDEINDYLMQGVLVFAGTAARGSAIGTPVEGQFSFLTDTDTVEFYDGSAWTELSAGVIQVDYVLIAGGGGGGKANIDGSGGIGGAGAGGGGYRANVTGENSGGGLSAGPQLYFTPGSTAVITVGAGGSGSTVNTAVGTQGNRSVFGAISTTGGGGGSSRAVSADTQLGVNGGSGGGCTTDDATSPGSPVVGEGFAGGNATLAAASSRSGAGGGGAGAVGQDHSSSNDAGDGGAGVSSSLTGSSVGRAGGGGGGLAGTSGGSPGSASDGGGAGGTRNASASGSNGTANTGGGGGGGGGGSTGSAGNGGNGGSGVVIFAVPSGTTVSFSGGVTESNSTVGDQDVYVVTATSTTSETVTIG